MTDAETSLPSALMVIDVQCAMTRPIDPEETLPYRRDEMLANIQSLLAKARSANAKVIYVQHHDVGFDQMSPGNPGFEIDPDIAPLAGEPIVVKQICDSFAQTDLETMLRQSGVTHLVTCGMQTDMCVGMATRTAVNLGFNVTLAADAHSTWDYAGLTAEQIIAFHNKNLASTSGPGSDIWAKPAAEIEFAPAR